MCGTGIISQPAYHTKNLVDCGLAFQDATKYFRTPPPVTPILLALN